MTAYYKCKYEFIEDLIKSIEIIIITNIYIRRNIINIDKIVYCIIY